MNCPNCKTPTLISLSPVSWFCFRCGKFHTEFRLDGVEDAQNNRSAEIDSESVVDCTAVTPRQDKESGALVRQKGDFSAEY